MPSSGLLKAVDDDVVVVERQVELNCYLVSEDMQCGSGYLFGAM